MKQLDFQCAGCGLCCARVGVTVDIARRLVAGGSKDPYIQEVADFPYFVDDQGVCEMLVDGKCSVYEDRPDICSIDKTFDKYHAHTDREDYYLKTVAVCNVLRKEAGKEPISSLITTT